MTVAREGTREITIATVVCALIELPFLFLAIKYSLWFLAAGLPIWGLWLFVVLFFRDPNRNIPSEPGILVSPADGKVTEVSRLDRYDGIKGRALRISIFLSVFDVHINRVPCAGRVRKIEYKPGKFLDARHPDCSSLNESNTIEMDPGEGLPGPIIVRQVAGLIARRIICNLKEQDSVTRGQRLGLIKFGSRTDLIVPDAGGLEAAVKVHDYVKGGETVLFRVKDSGRSEVDRAAAVGAR